MRERLVRAGAPERVDGLVLGSGDDAAITERSGAVATSVDALVEGVHFRIPPFTLEDVGHKALATALSDLAAMGASAREAYVQLGLPPERAEGALALADGMGPLAAEHGVAIAGGDVTRAAELFCAVTVVGAAGPGGLVRRAGARPGDVLAVTGEVGGAAAGLLTLGQEEPGEGLAAGLLAALRSRQLRPSPRIGAGLRLAELGATAMIDLSDGLGGDARHLARASGVGIRIELDRLPVQEGVAEVASAAGRDVHDLVLGGGEDYELLVAVPPQALSAAAEALGDEGVGLTEIGSVTEGEDVVFSRSDGEVVRASGYDQLRSSRSPRGRA